MSFKSVPPHIWDESPPQKVVQPSVASYVPNEFPQPHLFPPWDNTENVHLLPTGSEEREVLGVGSVLDAILPSCQYMKNIAL